MKKLFTCALLVASAYLAQAQSNPNPGGNPNPTNPSGNPNGGNNGGSYNQNGNIPNQYEQNQNRADSSRSATDTLNRDQKWNDGSLQKQQPGQEPKKKNNNTTPKTGTNTDKKKK